MFSIVYRYSLIVVLIGLLSGCSLHERMHQKAYDHFFHEEFMSGQVVRVEGDQVVVCIGTENGAETGMVFQAYQVKFDGAIDEGGDNYQLHSVGAIEIGSLIDGHFARAKVLEGSVKPNDIVELSESK